jgi:hypothetical protein
VDWRGGIGKGGGSRRWMRRVFGLGGGGDGRGGSGDEGAGAGTRDCRVRSRVLSTLNYLRLV